MPLGVPKINLTINGPIRKETRPIIYKSKMRQFVSRKIVKTNLSIDVQDALPRSVLSLVQRHTRKQIVKIYGRNKSRMLSRNSKIKKNVGRVNLRSTLKMYKTQKTKMKWMKCYNLKTMR